MFWNFFIARPDECDMGWSRWKNAAKRETTGRREWRCSRERKRSKVTYGIWLVGTSCRLTGLLPIPLAGKLQLRFGRVSAERGIALT